MSSMTTKPIKIQISPKDINYVNRVMEGYEYLGVVSTLDRTAGILVIRATPDTAGEVRTILANLTVTIRYMEETNN